MIPSSYTIIHTLLIPEKTTETSYRTNLERMGYSSKYPYTPHRRVLCLGGNRISSVSGVFVWGVHGGKCPGVFVWWNNCLEVVSGCLDGGLQ